MAHGINDNVVHNWRKLARGDGATMVVEPSGFVPVTLAAGSPQGCEAQAIEVELRRGAVMMKIRWPLSATADFTTWMRELLR
jgi:transposase